MQTNRRVMENIQAAATKPTTTVRDSYQTRSHPRSLRVRCRLHPGLRLQGVPQPQALDARHRGAELLDVLVGEELQVARDDAPATRARSAHGNAFGLRVGRERRLCARPGDHLELCCVDL